MTTLEDAELLRRYAADRSEAAFGELVRRHLAPVYAFALRRVGGDAHLAEDVAQVVFATLARKAASLTDRQTLGGWLCRTTHFAARDVVRVERRRRAREEEAQTMDESPTGPDANIDWEKLHPVLNEMMGELNDDDRDAVWLRFFEGRSFAEVGARLRLTENAARMRVERALDKLHGLLARRGVTSTTAALAVALAGQATMAAPAGLAASVAGGALAAAGASAVGSAAIFMSMNKIGIAAAVLIAGGAAGVFWQQRNIAPLRREIGELRPQVQEIARLRAENERLAQTSTEVTALRAEHEELVKLRGEVAGLKKELSRPRTGAEAGRVVTTGPETPEPRLISTAQLSDVGRATPRATGQTLAWALQNGEVDVVANLVTFEPDARKKMEELVATLPEPIRSQYNTPEKLLALAVAGGSPIVGVQLLSEEETGPDDAQQRVQLLYRNGKLRTQDIHFRRDDGGWKQVITVDSARRIEVALHEKADAAAGGK